MLNELFDDITKFIHAFEKRDSKELRKSLLITDRLRYWYCLKIADRRSVWSKITEDHYLLTYCRDVKDREAVWRKLTADAQIVGYCASIMDREELWSKLTDDEYLYEYLTSVVRRKELSSRLTNESLVYAYCCHLYNIGKDSTCGRIEELSHKLQASQWACAYCCVIDNDLEVAKRIIDAEDIGAYYVVRKDSKDEAAWGEVCKAFPKINAVLQGRRRKEAVAELCNVECKRVQRGPRHTSYYTYIPPIARPVPF